jgi:hypothetical protein
MIVSIKGREYIINVLGIWIKNIKISKNNSKNKERKFFVKNIIKNPKAKTRVKFEGRKYVNHEGKTTTAAAVKKTGNILNFESILYTKIKIMMKNKKSCS